MEDVVGFQGLRPRWRPTEVFKGWFMPRKDGLMRFSVSRWRNWTKAAGAEAGALAHGLRTRCCLGEYLKDWGPHESS